MTGGNLAVLLELECLQDTLALALLEVDSSSPFTKVLSLLVDTMVTILKDTTSKDSLDKLEEINSGAMT